MFVVLLLLIVYALLTFGAVLPTSWYLLSFGWLVIVAGLVIHISIRQKRLSVSNSILLLFTSASLALLLPKFAVALCAAAWAAVAADGDEKRTLWFLRALLMVGTLEALLGLIQFLVSPGWIFGYMNLSSRSSGTLINRNHFAGLLEMLAPIAVGFAYIAMRRYREPARSYVFLLAATVIGLAICFSLSRAGMLTFFLTIVFLVGLVRMREARRRLALGIGLSVFGLVIAGAAWMGIDVIVTRYAQLLEQDAVINEGRLIVFRDTVRMIADNPLGVGMGRYQDYFRRYQTFRPEFLFDHAHNDYLETTSELGVPLAILFWGAVFYILSRAARAFLSEGSPERRGILLASSGGVFAMLVHSLTDFNLQIPSNAMIFFSFVGIAFAHSFKRESHFNGRVF